MVLSFWSILWFVYGFISSVAFSWVTFLVYCSLLWVCTSWLPGFFWSITIFDFLGLRFPVLLDFMASFDPLQFSDFLWLTSTMFWLFVFLLTPPDSLSFSQPFLFLMFLPYPLFLCWKFLTCHYDMIGIHLPI
jgi:hypothetical protein